MLGAKDDILEDHMTVSQTKSQTAKSTDRVRCGTFKHRRLKLAWG